MYVETCICDQLFSFLLLFSGLITNCPECKGKGKDAPKECEENISMEDCGENQVCVVGSLRNGLIFHRGCLTKNQFESKKAKCEKSTGKRKCIVAMCDTPNCRPELP